MAESDTCFVCAGSVDALTSSVCSACGERFHLNQRNDRAGKDCGAVWINEQHLGLEFACQRCLDEAQPPEAAPAPQAADETAAARKPQRRYRKRA